MDRKTAEIINDYFSFLVLKYPNLKKAYLFGSYAKNREKDGSDIDIALVFTDLKEENKFDLQVQLMLQASEYDLRIEPHPFSDKEFNSWHPLVVEIKNTGIEINSSYSKEVSSI